MRVLLTLLRKKRVVVAFIVAVLLAASAAHGDKAKLRDQPRLNARGKSLAPGSSYGPIGSARGVAPPSAPPVQYFYPGPTLPVGVTTIHNLSDMSLTFGIQSCSTGEWFRLFLPSNYYDSYPNVCGIAIHTDLPDGRMAVNSYGVGPGIYLLGVNTYTGLFDVFLP